MIAWTLELLGRRYWSGSGDLEFDGEQWAGDSILGLGDVTSGGGPGRADVTLDATAADVRTALLQDPGPQGGTITWIASADGGRTWAAAGLAFTGRISGVEMDGTAATVTLEEYSGDVDRGRPRGWSDEAQRARHEGDRGFEQLRALAEAGIETRWPP